MREQRITEMSNDMIVDLQQSKRKKDVYKVEAERFKKGELQQDIGRAIGCLKSEGGKVDFADIEDVKRRTIDYFTACEKAGIYPSVQGLASYGFGISRQWLNYWKNKNEKTEVAVFIDQACDLMADILTNQALHNNANTVQAIFQLRNNHAFADRIEIQPIKDNPYESSLSPAEIREKYDLGLPPADDAQYTDVT